MAGKAYHKMALEDNGTCKAWQDGKCAIHDFSPALCQTFPFYFDMFAGLCAIECEGFDDDTWTDLKDYDRLSRGPGKCIASGWISTERSKGARYEPS